MKLKNDGGEGQDGMFAYLSNEFKKKLQALTMD